MAWNDNPDDESASFVRDTPRATTSISDYDINYPQVLNNELRKQLVGSDNGGLAIPVVEVPAGQAKDTVTLFLSGDGGWRDLDRDVAGEMAKIGYPVVGIDTLRYYWQHKSPEQSAKDLTELMQHYRQKWGTKRFVLTGYSFGADVLPAIYNRLPEAEQQRVDAIILLAFARTGSFEIEVEGWLGNAGKEAATGPEMAKLPAAKVVCIYGEEEVDESGCTDKTAVGEAMKLPGGHHFDENYPALAKRLVDIIEKRQAKGRITPAELGQCGSWLACDSGVSVTYVSTEPLLSRASPLPHKPAGQIQPLLCMALYTATSARMKNAEAARPAVGVHLVAFDQVHFPLPLRRIRTEGRCLGDQALGDGLYALGVGAGLVHQPLATGVTQGLLVRLRVHLVDFLARQHAEHVLLALHTHGTAAGGVNGLATGEQQGCAQCRDHQ